MCRVFLLFALFDNKSALICTICMSDLFNRFGWNMTHDRILPIKSKTAPKKFEFLNFFFFTQLALELEFTIMHQ